MLPLNLYLEFYGAKFDIFIILSASLELNELRLTLTLPCGKSNCQLILVAMGSRSLSARFDLIKDEDVSKKE